MTNLRLQNPYFDQIIKVKEDCSHIEDMLEWIEQGNMQYLKLQQIEPDDRMITISPKNFAKIDYYDDEKQKYYRVSMPKTRNHKDHAQLLCEADGKVFWCGECYNLRTKFTHKELEDAGFGWVFNCEGVEVKEVTDE